MNGMKNKPLVICHQIGSEELNSEVQSHHRLPHKFQSLLSKTTQTFQPLDLVSALADYRSSVLSETISISHRQYRITETTGG